MPTFKNSNSIYAESLTIEIVDYRSVISPIAKVEIQQLLCEYGISTFLWVILEGKQDGNALP